MKLPISKRLLCCAGEVTQGARVADIGADHGYLSIHLLQTGKASFVHASDLREQPIQRARENAQRFGIREQIRFSCADGLQAIDPQEVDTIVCAGMGGDLMGQILSACPWVRNERYRLILQPQSSGNDLRRYLSESGFRIERETLVEDGGFLYFVIVARYGQSVPLTPGEQYVSPSLWASGDPLLQNYVNRILHALELTVEGIRRATDPEARERLPYYETALLQVRTKAKEFGFLE